MLTYPVKLIPGEDGLVLVIFPDLPEAVSCGDGEEDAIARAGDLLDTILGCYRSEGRPIPQPSRIRNGPKVTSGRFGRHNLPSPDNRRPAAKTRRGRTEPRSELVFL